MKNITETHRIMTYGEIDLFGLIAIAFENRNRQSTIPGKTWPSREAAEAEAFNFQLRRNAVTLSQLDSRGFDCSGID